MESLSPNFFVNDMNATIAFYELLGFSVTMSVPEESPDLVWAMMANGSVNLMFQTMESLAGELPQINRTEAVPLPHRSTACCAAAITSLSDASPR